MAGNQDFARFNIIVGTNGTGKSTFMDSIIQKTHFGNALAYVESIDTAGKPFSSMPVIRMSQYAGGKACIDADTIGFEPFLNHVYLHYRNGLVVIDEAGMYKIKEKGDELIWPVVRLLKQRRKFNVEMYFIYHSVSEVPVRLFKWCNNVILFHQTDMFSHKGGVVPRINELNAAKARVEEQYFNGNRFYCERVQLS